MFPMTAKKKKIVLIDDDEVYNAIMLRAAASVSVNLEVYSSLLALGSVTLLGRYDAVIVDYHLDQMTGIEVAEYLSAFFTNLPMILVSQTPSVASEVRSWPDCIASFIPKSAGYVHVIEQAAQLAERLPPPPVVRAAHKAYNFN